MARGEIPLKTRADRDQHGRVRGLSALAISIAALASLQLANPYSPDGNNARRTPPAAALAEGQHEEVPTVALHDPTRVFLLEHNEDTLGDPAVIPFTSDGFRELAEAGYDPDRVPVVQSRLTVGPNNKLLFTLRVGPYELVTDSANIIQSGDTRHEIPSFFAPQPPNR